MLLTARLLLVIAHLSSTFLGISLAVSFVHFSLVYVWAPDFLRALTTGAFLLVAAYSAVYAASSAHGLITTYKSAPHLNPVEVDATIRLWRVGTLRFFMIWAGIGSLILLITSGLYID
jgi:hypothetical protein